MLKLFYEKAKVKKAIKMWKGLRKISEFKFNTRIFFYKKQLLRKIERGGENKTKHNSFNDLIVSFQVKRGGGLFQSRLQMVPQVSITIKKTFKSFVILIIREAWKSVFVFRE